MRFGSFKGWEVQMIEVECWGSWGRKLFLGCWKMLKQCKRAKQFNKMSFFKRKEDGKLAMKKKANICIDLAHYDKLHPNDVKMRKPFDDLKGNKGIYQVLGRIYKPWSALSHLSLFSRFFSCLLRLSYNKIYSLFSWYKR